MGFYRCSLFAAFDGDEWWAAGLRAGGVSVGRELEVWAESWPLAGEFRISRGAVTEVVVVVVRLVQVGIEGLGEARPYGRFGESVASVMAQIESARSAIEAGMGRVELLEVLPAGAARNALDCALWDLEARLAGRPVWQLAGLAEPGPVTTAFTLSLADPESMGEAARRNADRPLLKLKLGGGPDLERVRAVRAAAPEPRIMVDANEGWTVERYLELTPRLAELGVELIEQPLPEEHDEVLARLDRPVAICADESCRDRATLHRLVGRYDLINIKLDKTGGLTEALALREAALAAGFGVMVGSMVATSLSAAPAFLVAQGASVVDLDGPLLLVKDRQPGMRYQGSSMSLPRERSWGDGKSTS